MRSAYEHLYNRLISDASVTALLPIKYRGSNEPVFNSVPEDAPSTLIRIGDPVTSEDRGAKSTDQLSTLISQDLLIHTPRVQGSESEVISLATVVHASLNRWTSATLRQGLSVERSTATFGPRVDDDNHYISVVSWIGLLRQP